MEKEINLRSDKLRYTLKKSKRAKHIILNVGCDARVSVTIPWRASEVLAKEFIQKKCDWVLKKVKYYQTEGKPLIPGPSKEDFANYKGLALNIIEKKIERFNAFYGFEVKKVTVRNQKARWGSCSRRGHLSFCYRIIYLPENMSDYVIVHELCHLAEFNHGKNFWKLVSRCVPDYADIRKKVRAM